MPLRCFGCELVKLSNYKPPEHAGERTALTTVDCETFFGYRDKSSGALLVRPRRHYRRFRALWLSLLSWSKFLFLHQTNRSLSRSFSLSLFLSMYFCLRYFRVVKVASDGDFVCFFPRALRRVQKRSKEKKVSRVHFSCDVRPGKLRARISRRESYLLVSCGFCGRKKKDARKQAKKKRGTRRSKKKWSKRQMP